MASTLVSLTAVKIQLRQERLEKEKQVNFLSMAAAEKLSIKKAKDNKFKVVGSYCRIIMGQCRVSKGELQHVI